jgi:endonuclease/exonuclease/phosphatase family metal-dependent hydrolase
MIRKQISQSSALLLLILAGCHSMQKTEMNIMTFNILYNSHKVFSGNTSWEVRRPLLITCLQNHTPDLLGTQESFEFQTDALLAAFPGWRVFGEGRYHQVQAVSPRRPYEDLGGESCRILYDQTKYRLVDHGTFWHSDYPDSAGSRTWGNELPRVLTWGKFQINGSAKKFIVMNTHFHWGQPYVQNAAQLIMRKWREISQGLPTILMGDFNLEPTSPEHELFCGRSGPAELRGRFRDCWQILNKPEAGAGTGHGFTGKGTTRIDWILVTEEFTARSIEILYDQRDGIYPSDHFPVLAKLSL